MKEKISSKSKTKKSSKAALANTLLRIRSLLVREVEPADDGTIDDFFLSFSSDENLAKGLSKKAKVFYFFEPEYYIQRCKALEAEIVDVVRRRMVPDAKREITENVNSYNVISCDKLEWKALLSKLEMSASSVDSRVQHHRVKDRGFQAGSSRKGNRYKVTWQNDTPNSSLPVLNGDRYWWAYTWKHMEANWRAMVNSFSLVFIQEKHKLRIQFEYAIWRTQFVPEVNDTIWIRQL